MDIQPLNATILALLELPPSTVAEEVVLASNELWDSLAMVSLLAFIADHYHVSLDADALSRAESVLDIWQLVQLAATSAA